MRWARTSRTTPRPRRRANRPPAEDGGAAAPARSYEELVDELHELGKKHPAPVPAELEADARWFAARWGRSEFEPYRGSCVAVLNGAVVARGGDEGRLRLELARRLDVHPARLVIAYIPLRGQWATHVHVPSDS